MDFAFSEQQNHFVKLATDFASEVMMPHAPEWDAHKIFPVDVIRQAAKLGFASIPISENYGGVGGSRLDTALVFEALSRACPSTTAYLSIHTMVQGVIDRFGTEEQKQKWLPQLSSMDLFSSYCLTEPSAGSDAASLKTTATKKGADYVLNGSKMFISGGSVSDIYLVMARTGEAGAKGISCFLLEKGTKGLSFGKLEHKMGWNSQPTTAVFFDDCRVPQENLIGGLGDGFKIALAALDGGRVNIAACSLGGAAEALHRTQIYTKERKQFGIEIAAFQNTAFKLADMATNLDAARLLVYRAAKAIDDKAPEASLYASMAKRFATDHCFDIANGALQLHGGYGYLHEYGIERYVRDLRVHQILEGTNEIMRVIIAKRMDEK